MSRQNIIAFISQVYVSQFCITGIPHSHIVTGIAFVHDIGLTFSVCVCVCVCVIQVSVQEHSSSTLLELLSHMTISFIKALT